MSQILADFDEILFEGRGKDYGAYQMRKKYPRLLGTAALIALLMFTAGTSLTHILPWFFPEEEVKFEETLAVIPVNLEAPPPDLNKEEPPPPPPEIPEPPKVETIRFVVPIPDEDVSEDSTITEVEKLDSSQIAAVTQQGDPNAEVNWEELDEGNGVGELPPDEPEVGPNDWVDLQEEPKPVNMDQFRQAVGYPEMAKQAEIQGKVIVRVQVDKTGNYVKHVVLRDPHPLLTNAVVAKLSQLRFTPGLQAGKPVKVWVTIPVDFQLNK